MGEFFPEEFDLGLTGTIEHQLDDKFRVRIPSRFFPLGENGKEPDDKSGYKFYLAAGAQGFISVYTREMMGKRIQRLKEREQENETVVNSRRKIMRLIEQVETDKQGRFVLPAHMRAHAKIKKDLVSVGMGDHFEVWAKEVFSPQDEAFSLERASAELGIFL